MVQNTDQNVQEIDANNDASARVFFPADHVEQTPTASSEMRSVVSDVSVNWSVLIHIELLPFTNKQTNKHVQLNVLVTQVTCVHGSVVPSLFSFQKFKTLSYFGIRYVFLLQ